MHDYVIIGAGSAGCVLANRLSEDPEARVLLLEAGGESEGVTDVSTPVAFSELFKTERDWNYTTAPQEHLFGRELYWPRGKMLGGSSAINAMIAMRGHRADYDGWAEADCDGWSYAEVLPYFKRLETNERGPSRYHGGSGPLCVSELTALHPLTQALVRAAIEAGMPYNPDFNGADQEGVGLNQVTQKDGQRHSAAAAYLQPARHRENLTVMTGAHVQRIEVEDGRATGVTYVEDGTQWSAEARAEVILCAGAVGSPHLLMLSGIGPAGHLEDRGVRVRHDLPGVGQNLQDHLSVPVCMGIAGVPSLAKAETWGNIARYLLGGSGPLTSNVAEASVFFHTRDGLPAPDMQLHAAPLLYHNHALEDIEDEAFTLGPTLLQPKSIGHLALRPDDPAGKPVIQPRYLSDPGDEDMTALVSAIRTAREIFAQRPFDRFRTEELLPGPEKTTDEELRAHVRLDAETIYHPVGTCAMGTGAEAVVDPELRVRGVEGLRVADASVMPRVVRGNTNLPTIMIGEKASDLIRGRAPLPVEAQCGRASAAAA